MTGKYLCGTIKKHYACLFTMIPGDLPKGDQKHRLLSPPEQYSVKKGTVRVDGFGTFYDAYIYGLNRFCSENFLVWREGSEPTHDHKIG